MTAAILNERDALLTEAQALIAEPLDDGKRARLDDIQTRVASLDDDLERAAKVEALLVSAAKPLDRADTVHRRSRSEFSILKAMRAKLGRSLPSDDDGFEREVIEEMRRTDDYEGVPVPLEALSVRAPVYTDTATSGNIIPDDHRPDMYIEPLRNALVASRLGVRSISGLSGNIEIPTGDAITTASFKSESAAFDESVPTFGQKTMTPRKVGAWAEWSTMMALQSSPGIEGLIRDDLMRAMATAIDDAVIYGGVAKATSGNVPYTNLTSGADIEPHGIIRNITNTARAGDTNGLALDFAAIEALPKLLDERNAPSDRAWLIPTAQKYKLMGLPRFASDGDRAAELAYANGAILGERAIVANMLATDERHGSSAETTSVYYGHWADMLIGYWQGVDLMLNPYADSSFKRGSIMVRVMAHVDLLVRREQSFARYDAII
jgi:HK97 family phage major capsid protein